MRKFHFVRIMFAALAFAALFTACQKDQVAPKGMDDAITMRSAEDPTSDGGIVPILFTDGQGGNVECSGVFDVTGCSFENTSERFDDGAQFSGTTGPITWWTTDGKYVSWESDVPVRLAVIVKGGPGANVYIYGCKDGDECYTGDSGLMSPPVGGNDNTPDLSNITFCWTLCEPPVECEEETAWAAGLRYVNRGNWATYTPYVANSTVTLYAGQTRNAGTVHFSAVVHGNVTITITFNAGWGFQDVDENLKIQDYAFAPSGNPNPGGFEYKFTNQTVVVVPANNFYGVHVDAQYCE